jgi:hypothetical protein
MYGIFSRDGAMETVFTRLIYALPNVTVLLE